MSYIRGRYFIETYINPNNLREKIEVKNYGNGHLMYRQYIADSLLDGLRHYKGSGNWRTITKESLINITTTFEGRRWLKRN